MVSQIKQYEKYWSNIFNVLDANTNKSLLDLWDLITYCELTGCFSHTLISKEQRNKTEE